MNEWKFQLFRFTLSRRGLSQILDRFIVITE
jgi:hypothetical protein